MNCGATDSITETLNSFFENLYKNFNTRKIEPVISVMTEDVEWANGMDGGHVYGHDGVREYWTRQFGLISANVTPLKIENKNGVTRVEVHQVVHTLDKKLLADEIVEHFFQLKDGKVSRFDIGQTIKD